MDESNNEQQIILDYLEKRNNEARTLLDKYEKTLQGIIQNKEQIDNYINESNTNIASYQEKIDKIILDVETNKNQITEKHTEIIKNNDSLMQKYENEAKEKLAALANSIVTVQDYLKEEESKYNVLCTSTKTEFVQKSTELSNLIVQYNTQTTESTTKIKTNLEDAEKNSAKIRQTQAEVQAFKESVDKYVENMQETTKNINERTNNYEKNTQDLIDKNIKLTTEIEEQLSKATGVSLFHMFQNRKEQLEKNQGYWLGGVIFSVLILIGFSCWIIASIQSIPQSGSIDWFKDAIFKFTLSTPVIYLLYFLADRYTKLRRLIEEYAFKSAISLALTPYFDLVKGLDNKAEEKDKDFLIAVIGNIFKTPTDKVFRTKEGHYDLDFSNYYKNIANIIIPEQTKEK